MMADRQLGLTAALPMFFVVGAGALIVETTWLRWFRGVLGATAPAVSAALVAVTLGLFFGALLGGWLARQGKNALGAFSVALLVAAAFALGVRPLLDAVMSVVDSANLSSSSARTLARFTATLAATLPASTAIGTAFPLLVAATTPRTTDLGDKGTALYAAELLGASFGAAVTIFWLPAHLGVHTTYLLGVAALTAPALPPLMKKGARHLFERVKPSEKRTVPFFGSLPFDAAGMALGSGFGVFAAQLLLHQAFGRVLDQSTFALGAVLVTVLLSLALGAGLARWLQRRASPELLVGAFAGLAALGFAFFPGWFLAATDGLSYLVSPSDGARYVPRALGLCAITAGPPLVSAAVVFPALLAWVGRRHQGDGGAAGQLAGGLLAANTVGTIAGAIAAPYALIPSVGLWTSFLVLAGAYAAIAFAALRGRKAAWLVAGAVLVACVASGAWRHSPVRLEPGDRLLRAHSSAAGLVAVIERDGGLLIQTDNHYVLGGSADAVHQRRQGHLPLLLHPFPRRVAFVGTATGSSASAALDHEVTELVTVEIMPEVTEAAAQHFAAWNEGVYLDPRTTVVEDDVRSFIRRGREPFDVIVADLFVPWRSETGSLYTVEHFSRTKSLLAPGGLFCQWLPLYQLTPAELESILATFLRVFPDAQIFRGDFYGAHGIVGLVGGVDGPPELATAAARAELLGARGIADRWMTDPLGPAALYVGPLRTLSKHIAGASLNTENEPVVEVLSARNRARHAGRRDWTASGEVWIALSQIMAASDEASAFLQSPSARRASEGGLALQAASTHWVAQRPNEASRALEIASQLLPQSLLANAPADPTAADVWHER